MGGSSSKAVRKLPKRRETPSWAGARSSPSADLRPRASEVKNEAIDNDSRDPQFLSKLNSLGPVKVDHHMRTVPAQNMHRMFESRARSDSEASAAHPTRDRLLASSLSELLDARKSVSSCEDLEDLANKYDIELSTLESLGRFINSPSVAKGTSIKTIGEDGEEHVSMTAIWVGHSAEKTLPQPLSRS